jgi:hypothetical protein
VNVGIPIVNPRSLPSSAAKSAWQQAMIVSFFGDARLSRVART